MSNQGQVIPDETPDEVVVHFSSSADTVCALPLEDDKVLYWQIPDTLLIDILTEIVDTISDPDTDRFIEIFDTFSSLWDELRRWNKKRVKWFGSEETCSKVRETCSHETSLGDFVLLFPSQGDIKSVDVRITDEIDPSGKLRRKINQLIASINLTADAESDADEEIEEGLDAFVDDKYQSDEEEEIDEEVRANPEKPCYFPSQIEMAAILKKRIDTIMDHYHKITSLSDVFNDVEFVVYTARYRMLSDQTEKRIRHPDAGVLSKEELKSRDDSDTKKRMFMYIRSLETDDHFEKLKRSVRERPDTLFVVIADECHWGITKDGGQKSSAHNLFINEWCKGNSPKNVIVVQISATPFNLLTQNSRLPVVPCAILNEKVSTTQRDYEEGDLVVLEREPDLEERVRKNSKEVELHVVHWSEVELKNFEGGMRMKLKSTLNLPDARYQYLRVSSIDGTVGVTSSESEATDFIVQGSRGIVILKVMATNGQDLAKPLTITADEHGNLIAKADPLQPTTFEVKLDFGVGILAFSSCKNPDHFIAVDEHECVTLQSANIERKCGVCIMKPKHKLARVAFEFYMEQSGPVEVGIVGQQYMSLNFYLSTINNSDRNDQKIREDKCFQEIVDRAKRQMKKSKTDKAKSDKDSPSFPIDALLCAEYCYHILHASVYDSNGKIRRALTASIDESPVAEFHRKLDSFVGKLRNETTNPKKYIEAEAFEFVRKELSEKATHDFENKLKELKKLRKRNSTKDEEDIKEVEEDLTSSFVTCLMHLDQQKFQQKVKENPRSSNVFEEMKQKLQDNNCQVLVDYWKSIVQKGETSSLVENLIQSGIGNMGKMKIVRAKSGKTADQFYFTLRLARTESCFEERFEVIKDYGGIQIENHFMKSSSPFFRKLQTGNCHDNFDCSCKTLRLEEGRKKCSKCHHVHKLITQYEDLENLACVLILVEKGRMGDTFPKSFDCLDLRLNNDSNSEFREFSSLYLSTVIQELGRMCRYSKSSANESPYVLVGRALFKTLQKSLETSPSMSAIACNKADRYMAKSSRKKDQTWSSLRWLDHEAHTDSFDYQNVQTHPNRILLQAEPQIGKTGTYLCLIRELRLDILGKEKASLSSAPAFDEGIFYFDKECHLSEELLVSEMEEKQDWQFPYWKTIQNSPSLNEKPVASGKYSIGGCFYTHDMEESPYILMSGQKLTKSSHQYQARECTGGVRAWHWYHFETCSECGRLLQGKEPVLETFEVNIDDTPVNVVCSVPEGRPSFEHLLEQLKNTRSTGEAVKELSAPPSPYWIFHASHRNDPRKCTLNYHHVMQENRHVHDYVQIAVVRSEKFKAYRLTWGKVLAIVQLPDTLPNCDLKPSQGGVGYARLFIQKMAFALNQECIFMIDDNVVAMSEAVFSTGDPSATEGRVVRDENGVIQMQRCSFLKPLTHLRKIAQGKEKPGIDESSYEPHPFRHEFESQELPLYSYTGPAKLFRNKQHESYGILGLMRSVPVAVNPFSKTQVYAAILLNVKSTVEKGVFYRPWPCWEDLRFNDDCDKAGLWVVKCNRYSFLKAQYKDWINNLALPKIFEWNDDSNLEERPLSSELPKDLEEGIILEHLRNFVNMHGPEKCFKGCIGYESQGDIGDKAFPPRIVQQVNAKEGTEEDFANENPVHILSYCVTNRLIGNIVLLKSRFCNTKEEIVFVTNAKEAVKKWPQMTKATIRTENGICLTDEMVSRNAEFAIYSAADPKRHRLRYILIKASFPQEHKNDQEEIVTTRVENSPSQSGNEPNEEESTLSHYVQSISNTKKCVKRSLQESLDNSIEIKRRKTNDKYSQRLEGSSPGTSDDVTIVEERSCQKSSHDETKLLEKSRGKRQEPEAMAGEFKHGSKNVYNTKIICLDSFDEDDEMVLEEMDLSDSNDEECEEVDNGCDLGSPNEDHLSSARKRDARNETPGCTEENDGDTKRIVKIKKTPAVAGEFKQKNKEVDNIKIISVDSFDGDEDMDLEKMDLYDCNEEEYEEVDYDNSILSEDHVSSEREQDVRNENPGCTGGTSDGTKLIVKRKKTAAVVGKIKQKNREVDTTRIISLDSFDDDEKEMDLKKMDLSDSNDEEYEKLDNCGDVSIPSEDLLSSARERNLRTENPGCTKGTNADAKGTERKKSAVVAGGFAHKNRAIVRTKTIPVDSVDEDEEIAFEKMDSSDSNEEEFEEADNDCNVSIMSEEQGTSARKRNARNGNPGYMEGTNDVTKSIVDLWREYRNLPGSSKKGNEQSGINDLTEEYVKRKLARFTTDQLQATDEKGYTALLKACSLPSMSPHVMQYLITTRKVDLNCQLPPNFDRNNSVPEGLVPGMSALSVAIKSGNVRSVPTFNSRRKDISIPSADDDGNNALHHCALSVSKYSFENLFPLFKPLKWKNMRNKEGKNPLEILQDMKGFSEGKRTFMLKEMQKKDTTLLDHFFSPKPKNT
ncbi:hypothetical protein ACROYT_G016877 [Oculina patagonica]